MVSRLESQESDVDPVSWDGHPKLGVAYSGYTPDFTLKHPEEFDYVEVPFELLRHDPSVISIADVKPIVLHCASLSIAGTVPPATQVVEAVASWAQRTGTPWIGEHLSFVTASRENAGPFADEYAPGEPYNIGYTVSPPMNESALEVVLRALDFCRERFDVPVLLENAPIYFRAPGTTMTQVEFLREICARAPQQPLLIDLAHFYITSQTTKFDPFREIESLPLERVVEVHVSGVDDQEDGHWDNHAARAPEAVLELLALVLRRARVKAVTLEYNWSSQFPATVLLEEIHRVREVVAGAAVV